MTSPIFERLRDAVSQAHWNEAVALLQTSDGSDAADALGHLPFEQQQSLFRHLPLDLAAKVVAQFPYYHQYVLLHSLPMGEMRALVDRIDPDDRMRLFDELPEEAWQRMMDELSGALQAEAEPEPETAREPEPQPPQLPEAGETIIEGRQIEKSYTQPDGRDIQIIAPMDLSVESGIICAAWAFGVGEIDLAENSVGINRAFEWESAGAWSATRRVHSKYRDGVPEFCVVPVVNGAGEC
jgi:hypothetical protein